MLNLSAQRPEGPPAFHQSRLENPDSTAASNSPPCLHWPLGLFGRWSETALKKEKLGQDPQTPGNSPLSNRRLHGH